MAAAGSGPPSCPRCQQASCLAHVEQDRIAWWSCENCGYLWNRGAWDPPQDDEAEALRAWLRQVAQYFTDQEFVRIVEQYDRADPITLFDRQVLLLGFEESIDHVMTVEEPRPETLLAPIPVRLAMLSEAEEITPALSVRTATYQRAGRFTYRRIR